MVLRLALVGIIPACAERSLYHQRCQTPKGDHPRVCGEKDDLPTAGMPSAGSSPRVRGEGWQSEAMSAAPGIIPACAGRSD